MGLTLIMMRNDVGKSIWVRDNWSKWKNCTVRTKSPLTTSEMWCLTMRGSPNTISRSGILSTNKKMTQGDKRKSKLNRDKECSEKSHELWPPLRTSNKQICEGQKLSNGWTNHFSTRRWRELSLESTFQREISLSLRLRMSRMTKRIFTHWRMERRQESSSNS